MTRTKKKKGMTNNNEKKTSPDSDKERLVTPCRLRHTGDKLKLNSKPQPSRRKTYLIGCQENVIKKIDPMF